MTLAPNSNSTAPVYLDENFPMPIIQDFPANGTRFSGHFRAVIPDVKTRFAQPMSALRNPITQFPYTYGAQG